MNTPAHLALSAIIWRRELTWLAVAAVAFGALMPDLPIVGFYLYEKLYLGTSEELIWSSQYFQSNWQLFFDLFNSIPILLAIALSSYFLGYRLITLIAASSLVHVFFDFPLHHDDAHRHFLPLSTWRFASPVSYWDPRYYGHIMLWIEASFTLFACSFVCWRGPSLSMRIVAAFALLIYLSFLLFAFSHWA